MSKPQRRPAPRRALLGVFLAIIGIAALRVWIWQPERPSGEPLDDGYARAVGAVHVHTTLSDGGGTPEDVAFAARAAGLAFVFITDHNNQGARAFEGYHDGVLVGVGSEISTTGGHLLALGVPDPAFRLNGIPDEALDDVRLLGGAAFAAHPLSPRPDFNWTGWELPGAWGLEILNGDSQWREAGWPRLAWSGALYGLNARRALLVSATRPARLLERWDALLARRDVAGLAGADAHARMALTRRLSLPLPSYAAMFGLMRNHVLLRAPLSGEAGPDLAAVLEALRAGRSFMAIDALCPADGFAFFAERDGERFAMGATVSTGPGLRLRAGGPAPAHTEYVLMRDGRELLRAPRLDVAVPGPGVYRVEAHPAGSDLAWVISNPIYVFDEAAAGSRRAAAAWPEAQEPPTARRTLDLAGFGPEFDEGSSVQRVVDAHGGRTSGPAMLLRFRLGQPKAGSSVHGWCALVSREPRDLSGFSGLTLGRDVDRQPLRPFGGRVPLRFDVDE